MWKCLTSGALVDFKSISLCPAAGSLTFQPRILQIVCLADLQQTAFHLFFFSFLWIPQPFSFVYIRGVQTRANCQLRPADWFEVACSLSLKTRSIQTLIKSLYFRFFSCISVMVFQMFKKIIKNIKSLFPVRLTVLYVLLCLCLFWWAASWRVCKRRSRICESKRCPAHYLHELHMWPSNHAAVTTLDDIGAGHGRCKIGS